MPTTKCARENSDGSARLISLGLKILIKFLFLGLNKFNGFFVVWNYLFSWGGGGGGGKGQIPPQLISLGQHFRESEILLKLSLLFWVCIFHGLFLLGTIW